mmetsp:Transcript_58627/g.96229  ORF Transcript_58627/g.96229 Transcript_58627/m.96229 type:complete len:88 (+) Transcript_58627:103-366(+)
MGGPARQGPCPWLSVGVGTRQEDGLGKPQARAPPPPPPSISDSVSGSRGMCHVGCVQFPIAYCTLTRRPEKSHCPRFMAECCGAVLQ